MLRLSTKAFYYQPREKCFTIEASDLPRRPGYPYPPDMFELVSHKTGQVRAFTNKKEIREKAVNEIRDILYWEYSCGEMKLRVFND